MDDNEDRTGGRRWAYGLVSAVGALLVVGLLIGVILGPSRRRLGSEDPSGVAAPAFALPLVGGGSGTMAQHLGNPVVLNFWASWCHSCKQQAPVLAAGSRIYEKDGVHFVGVDADDGESWAKKFVAEYGITYPVFLDRDSRVEKMYGLTGHPETFFIGRDGRVKAKWIGPVDASTLQQLVGYISGS